MLSTERASVPRFDLRPSVGPRWVLRRVQVQYGLECGSYSLLYWSGMVSAHTCPFLSLSNIQLDSRTQDVLAGATHTSGLMTSWPQVQCRLRALCCSPEGHR